MITVDHAVLVKRAQPDVFHYVTDARNDPHWVSFAIEARLITPGDVGQGARFRQVGEVMGFRVDVVWEIVEYQPYTRMIARTLTGPARFIGRYALETVPGGTRVRKSGEIHFGGLLTMAEPVLARLIQLTLEDDLARLKTVLEAGPRQASNP